MSLRRSAIGCEFSADFLKLSLNRICSDLVQVKISVSSFEFSLDLFRDPVDRSFCANSPAMETPATTRLVKRERNFYFVGAFCREVVYSVAAETLDEAWHKFGSSREARRQILFVIKTETEIYLAQGK